MLHSAWALSAGIGVVFIARERYHLVLWVALFLVLTWTSTLFFGRAPDAERSTAPPGLAHEITSYLTRVMYQETLFFLVPFYAYSTVVDSPNVLFMTLLGVLAVFSCMDLVFDRWLRTRPLFALSYFAIIAFAATNLLLPLLFRWSPRIATPLAALVAIAAAAPLAARTIHGNPWRRPRLILGGVAFAVVAIGFPVLVPPVPLRLTSATFASGIAPQSLVLTDTLRSPASVNAVGRSLVVLVEVFAPTNVPTLVQLEWRRNGSTIRSSRPIDIVANQSGFRVWDAWHPSTGSVPSGNYEVILRTSGSRIFGVAKLTVSAGD